MNKRPKKVNVFGKTYRIRYRKHAWQLTDEEDRQLSGVVDYNKLLISVHERPDQTEILDTLLHEILHIIEWETKMERFTRGKAGKNEQGHDDLSRIASTMADILIRNKWIVVDK